MYIVYVPKPFENIPFYERYYKRTILIKFVFDCTENIRE